MSESRFPSHSTGADEALVVCRMFLFRKCIERSTEAFDGRQRVEVRIRSASRRIGFQQLMQQFGKLLVHDGKRLKSRQIVYVSNQRAVVASTLIQYAPSKSADLVCRGFCRRNAADPRNFGRVISHLGDEGAQ